MEKNITEFDKLRRQEKIGDWVGNWIIFAKFYCLGAGINHINFVTVYKEWLEDN